LSDAEVRWMVYRVGHDRYRTPAALVQSIEAFLPPLALPVPSRLAGVLPLREQLVAVVPVGDTRARASRLLVVQTPRGALGIPCDAVEGLADAEACDTLPELDARALLDLARGSTA
jgi:hypothetical protein